MRKQVSVHLENHINVALDLYVATANNVYPEMRSHLYALNRSDVVNIAVNRYIRESVQKIVADGKTDEILKKILEHTKETE